MRRFAQQEAARLVEALNRYLIDWANYLRSGPESGNCACCPRPLSFFPELVDSKLDRKDKLPPNNANSTAKVIA
jgi:hypothetical protein